MNFHKNILNLDCEKEAGKVSNFILEQVRNMHRNGIVIGISGGVDSALAASLSVKALGRDKVFGLILPEKESNPVSEAFAKRLAEKLGIRTKTIEITRAIEAMGAYEERDKIIRSIFPEFNDEYKSKITLPGSLLEKDAYNVFTLIIDNNKGDTKTSRLNKENLNGIVAATCIKHRIRMIQLYYYAEKMNYLVCGTTNKTEAIEGDFVKYGDGGVDIEPLAHLFKTQIYQLAKHLGVTQEILDRMPSPDTFSFVVSDEEFYFRIPFEKLDPLLFAWENKIDIKTVCESIDLKEEQVKRAFRDFNSKYNATKHLRQMPPTL